MWFITWSETKKKTNNTHAHKTTKQNQKTRAEPLWSLKASIYPCTYVLLAQDVVFIIAVVRALRWLPCWGRVNWRKSLQVTSSSKTEYVAHMIVLLLSSRQTYTICTYMALHIDKNALIVFDNQICCSTQVLYGWQFRMNITNRLNFFLRSPWFSPKPNAKYSRFIWSGRHSQSQDVYINKIILEMGLC